MKFKIQNPKSKINSNTKYQMPKPRFCYLSFVFCHSFVIWILSFVILLSGCEAFVRKFTRKPKKENLPKEEMVLVPEEYKGSQMTKKELYRQYFLFWKSWQDELIGSLSPNANHKKQIGCAQQAIKNLMNLRALLSEERQKKLDIYIGQLNELEQLITRDVYGSDIVRNRQNAERIRRNILHDFSYQKISKDIPPKAG